MGALSDLKSNRFAATGNRQRATRSRPRRRDSTFPLGNRALLENIPGWQLKRMGLKVMIRRTKQAEDHMSKEGAQILLRAAKQEVPISRPWNWRNPKIKRGGKLKRSHYMAKAWRSGRYFVATRSRAKYAAFVHYGTRYQKANPWMYRALAKNRRRIASTMINVARKRIAA